MSQPPISDENKLSVLFKRFQGTAQAKPGYGTTAPPEYDSENYASLTSVLGSSVFVESVPRNISGGIVSMTFDTNIPDSSWNTDVWDQTISKTTVQDASGVPVPHLNFYKRVYLKSVNTEPNAWWLPESYLGSTWSTSTNILRNMIPWLYNDLSPDTYTPIVEYWNGSTWTTTGQNADAGWVIDYASGMLVFYNTPNNLSTNYSLSGTSADDVSNSRPRISFIRYEGKFLEEAIADGSIGGGSGASVVGLSDNSGQVVVGSTFDASAMLFNENQFDVVNDSGKAIISLSETAVVSDISRYFFDIPPAPYGGDISSNPSAVAAIDMSWQLPENHQTAVPLGKTPHYVDGLANVTDANVSRLPFFKELHIDVIEKSDPSKDPTNPNDWERFGTGTSNSLRPFFPPSLTSATMHADGTSGFPDFSFGSGVYPFTNIVTDQVIKTGKTYQFRIYLTNDASGTVIDPTYGNAVPWNYYYLPEGSGGTIALGSFGPPSAPTQADISNSAVQFDAVTVDIVNANPLGADASLNNIGWPIPSTFDLNTRFGGHVDGTPDTPSVAVQMPSVRSTIQDSSADILGPWGKTGVLDIDDVFTSASDLSFQSNNWKWYPETKYTLSEVYMQNDTPDFSNQLAYYQGSDTSCNTGIPTRAHLQAAQTRLIPASNLTLSENPHVSTISDAYPQWNANVNRPPLAPLVPDTKIEDVRFITSTQTFDCEIVGPNLTTPFANNSDKGGLTVGKDSSGVTLTSFNMSLDDYASNAIFTESTSAMVGYLDVSSINYNGTHFTISAEAIEGASVPLDAAQKNGYYTDVKILQANMVDICLNSIQDMCNNVYTPYNVCIQDVCGGTPLDKQTGILSIGRTPPTSISYNLPTSLDVDPPMNFTFFGQALPTLSNITCPATSYDINGIDLWWRKQLQLASTRCVYNNSLSLSQGEDTMAPIAVPWSGQTGTSKTINPTIEIQPSRIWDINTSSDSKRYSRNLASTTLPQFSVYIAGSNNVTKSPGDVSGNYPIKFGGNTDHLFWDYTWDNNPSGFAPSQIPNGFFVFTSGSPQPNFSGTKWAFLNARGNLTGTTVSSAGTLLSHWPNKMPASQLLWANRAFRGAGITTPPEDNPYYDFASNYYNPSVTISSSTRNALVDYSTDKTLGIQVGETFFKGNDGWWDDVNAPSSTTTYNNVTKFITFRTWMPPVDQITTSPTTSTQGYVIKVTNSSGIEMAHVNSQSQVGYWLYHVEVPPVLPAQYVPKTGQKVAGANPDGCYSSAIGVNGGYKVSNTVPSLGSTPQSTANLTMIEISIGLEVNSTDNIASIELEWVAD